MRKILAVIFIYLGFKLMPRKKRIEVFRAMVYEFDKMIPELEIDVAELQILKQNVQYLGRIMFMLDERRFNENKQKPD